MSPQLFISTYSEQFGHPGRGRTARPRPSSANRRNNPHPRPDFLLPLQLLPGSPRTPVYAMPPVGRPLFPPVRHLSFQETRPDNSQTGKLPHIPFNGSSATLPPAGRLQKLQPTATGMDYQVHTSSLPSPERPETHQFPLRVRELSERQMSAYDSQRRLQTTNPPVAPQAEYRRSRSHSTLDSCGGYSCFNVVKPFQAGHFTIHPQFVSEYLR